MFVFLDFFSRRRYNLIMEFPSKKDIVFSINNTSDHEYILKLGKALSSMEKIKVLYELQKKPMNLLELANTLRLPISSVSNHVNALADAQLILINYQPGRKGHVKMCVKITTSAAIHLQDPPAPESVSEINYEMPVGCFTSCEITAPCGMLDGSGPIGPMDNSKVFFNPARVNAELIWFTEGFITYKFPNNFLADMNYGEISFSLEICSEAIYYRNVWPSDISIIINDADVLTYTCPGDFGGRRGLYTPKYWGVNSTQFGLLKKFTVNKSGVYENEILKHTKTKIDDLNLSSKDFISFTLAIKKNAAHKGGINIFGKNFGDYPQAIIMTVK